MLNIFTIVLNGMPWIKHHWHVFCALQEPWHWSIVHGIADPVSDTGWCQRLTEVRDDGTVEYLKSFAANDARVEVTFAERWLGKTAMCNAALQKFGLPGILLQVDADELWTDRKLEILLRLFDAYPEQDAAVFLCRYFVGPRRVVTQAGTYGNHTQYPEWLRAWRWQPGRRFTCHEPPNLEGQHAAISPAITAPAGLVFDHMAYADEAAVAFKERYYGYPGAVEAWKRLQAAHGPADLRDYLPWVRERAISYELPLP